MGAEKVLAGDTSVVDDEQTFVMNQEDLDQERGDWEEARRGKHSR